MANTGVERTLTLTVSKKINGVLQSGYPIVYNGRIAFVQGSNLYEALSPYEMAILLDADYNARLADFKAYVESIEVGLTIDTTEAYKLNITSCPTA